MEPLPEMLTDLVQPHHTLILGPLVTSSIDNLEHPAAWRSDRLAAKKKTLSGIRVVQQASLMLQKKFASVSESHKAGVTVKERFMNLFNNPLEPKKPSRRSGL